MLVARSLPESERGLTYIMLYVFETLASVGMVGAAEESVHCTSCRWQRFACDDDPYESMRIERGETRTFYWGNCTSKTATILRSSTLIGPW